MAKQRAFHESPHRFRVFAGGMGSGKTLCGCAEAFQLSMEYPNNLGLIGRATYPELRDTTWKEFLEFPLRINGAEVELGSSQLVKTYNKAEHMVEFINGSTVLGRALENSFDKVKSLNLGWFWIDELTENAEEMWLGLVGRLRRKNVRHCGFGTTNPEGHDWVWKRFIANPDKNHFIVQASTEDNIHLPEGYVETLKSQFPDEWVKRYVHGSFDTFEGLVYKEWNDRHPFVVDEFNIPEWWSRYVVLDYGYRNPTGVLWVAVDDSGRATVYDEFYASGKLVSDVAEIIKAKTKDQRIQLYLIDPSCVNKNGQNGRSVIDEYSDHRLYFHPANNEVRAGIMRVSEYFKLSGGKPKLQITRNCINLRTELQTYRWKDIKVGAKMDAPEKPQKKDDHLVDPLRYMINYLYCGHQPKKKKLFDYKEILYKLKSPDNWKAA